jgi:type IV secretory pathway VirB10-like protein
MFAIEQVRRSNLRSLIRPRATITLLTLVMGGASLGQGLTTDPQSATAQINNAQATSRDLASSIGSARKADMDTQDVNPLRPELRPALRDPFAVEVTTPPPPPPAPTVYAQPVVQEAPVVQVEPAPSLQFSGRMRTPDGRVLVFARWGNGGEAVTLELGKTLTNGYRVERMSEQLVELLNPQTQMVVQLALPGPQRFEIR